MFSTHETLVVLKSCPYLNIIFCSRGSEWKVFGFFLFANIQIFWRMKIVKMANNMSQWAIAKKLGISKSDISYSFIALEMFQINQNAVALTNSSTEWYRNWWRQQIFSQRMQDKKTVWSKSLMLCLCIKSDGSNWIKLMVEWIVPFYTSLGWR